MKLIAQDGRQYPLDKPRVTIGRAPDNHIALQDARVSGHHAVIQREGGHLILTDLGSTNGTYVNRHRLTGPCRLRPGDFINLGNHTQLTVQDERGPRVAPTQVADGPPPPVAVPAQAPQPYAQAQYYQQPVVVQAPPSPSSKDRTSAGIMALLVGGIGIHKFYLGQGGWGVIYLLFCWTGIPAIVAFIEGIQYLSMSDEQFARRFG
jgi:TM2 domain-containing membrane protein YozV